METMQQPKITGYRKLTEAEAELMNEGKSLAQACGAFIAKLRKYPATPAGGEPGPVPTADGGILPQIDQRWVSIGATELQQGFMAVIRGIAQPSSF